MRGVHASVAAAAVATAIVAGCASTALRLDAGADGTTVHVPSGSTMSIALESNPTTGYDWYRTGALPSQLATESDDFKPGGAAGVVGAGGTRTIGYRAIGSGTATIHLAYVRPWETGVAPAKTFTLTVVVP